MGFGISYEMTITLFVVLFGLLFIVLGYTNLAIPFIQLTFLFGIVNLIIGWVRKDYDLFYTGVLLMIIPIILVSVLPTFGVPQSTAEAGLSYALGPIIAFLYGLYKIHPIFFVLFITILAYAFARK